MLTDICNYLQAQNLGTYGTDIFDTRLDNEPDNVIVVRLTGGPEPDRYLPTINPTFQVIVRNTDFDTGMTKYEAVRATLHQLANKQLGSTYFWYIALAAEGGPLGEDEEGRDTFSLNFECQARR